MRRLNPSDAMFLLGESRDTMMHVGSLMPFTPPEDAPPDYMRRLFEDMRSTTRVQGPWNYQVKTPGFLKNPFQSWVEANALDLDYHLRRLALPAPGDERELGVLVSRLHGQAIDFTRPPWELHVIEGLERNRFAFYVKIHHALIDGYTASKTLARAFSTSPTEMDRPPFFALESPKPTLEAVSHGALDLLFRQMDAAREVWSLFRHTLEPKPQVETSMFALKAPYSLLNGRIGRNRRVATQQYSLQRMHVIARQAGVTLNDVVLALCASSLRRFLSELNALPEIPLVAMLPVNIRAREDQGGGNAVGAILVSLATDVAHPRARLEAIAESTRRSKELLSGMSREAMLQLSALLLSPSGLQSVTGVWGRVRPQFNVCISNVPGPEEPLYVRGARLEAVYPLSIPIHGQALNITCQSYAGTLNFGFTGCRDSLPHMQRLAVHTGEALDELEKAVAQTVL